MSDTERGRILVVCTGNVCRSPFLERLLASALERDFDIGSAGTEALVGAPMDPRAAERSTRYGGDPTAFSARQLVPDMVAQADLVLTASRHHRARVASMHPRALRYAFTVGDFADLVSHDPEIHLTSTVGRDGLIEVVRLAAARRGLFPPRSAAEVDIVDPYRRTDAVFDQMVRQIATLLPPVVRALSLGTATQTG